MLSYLYNLASDKYRGFIPSLLKVVLFILSLVYGLIIRILMFVYNFNKYRADCKVISVGNITLGGTGKTPLVEYIAGYLKQQGHNVAILTRGYKSKLTRCARRNTQYENMGDEPYMLEKNLKDIPIIVDAHRQRGINNALHNYGVDTVILDDGFQQWKIKKDLEIVAIDATNPLGNRHMIPRGILRQPLSSLKKAGVFVLTKTNINPDTLDIKNFLSRLNPSAIIAESMHSPAGFYALGKNKDLLSADMLRTKTVTLISGIGAPDSFENLIKSLHINIGIHFKFPDHHNYSKADLDNIIKSSKDKNIGMIITTEKDAARLYRLFAGEYRLPIYVLRIELKITKDEERFCDRLLQLYPR